MPVEKKANGKGAKLRAARKAAGLTQKELASRLGSSQATVSAAEQFGHLAEEWFQDAVKACKSKPGPKAKKKAAKPARAKAAKPAKTRKAAKSKPKAAKTKPTKAGPKKRKGKAEAEKAPPAAVEPAPAPAAAE